MVVVCTEAERELAQEVTSHIGDLAVGIFDDAVMHHPIETVQAARDCVRDLNADCCVTVGGGTATGTGKLIALETGIAPRRPIPTTYAGSEMTPIYGITEGSVKRTGRDRKVLPRVVIYDPELTVSLPPRVSGPSGINAIAHSIEGLYAHDTNPITTLMAEESIRALARALPSVVREPGESGCAKRCAVRRVAGGHRTRQRVDGAAPQAVSHARWHVQPAACGSAHRHPAARDRLQPRLMRLTRCVAPPRRSAPTTPRGASSTWPSASGARTSLAALGMPADGLDRAADLAVQNQYPNPRPLERKAIRQLLEDAYTGVRPSSRKT